MDPIESTSPVVAANPEDEALRRIVERPDGFYWMTPDEHQEFGPFATMEEALAARAGPPDDGNVEELAEAEQALGMSGWVDPETGAEAEDTATRIEEH